VIRLLAELPINRGYNSARHTEMFTFDIPTRAHTFPYPVATRGYFFELEAARAEDYYSPPSSAETKNTWTVPSLLHTSSCYSV
jgi:hypothetical protein